MTTEMTEERGLPAGQAAARLGVAVTTLRSWDRRYGLGPDDRSAGRHRRYSPRDMARLELMSRLMADGVPAARAAELAQSTTRPERPALPRPQALRSPAPPLRVRGLRRAALTLNGEQLERILSEAVSEDAAAAWTGLICPVLRDIGLRHERTGQHLDTEHLLSRAASAAFARIPQPTGAGRPAVLLACTAEELHSLSLEALAAGLAERGIRSLLLGTRVPAAALAAAIARTGPRAVVLWAQSPATAAGPQLRAALAARPRPELVAAAGPGWSAVTLPTGAHPLTDFADALDLLTEVAVAAPAGR